MHNEREEIADPFEAAAAEIARNQTARYLVEWLWIQQNAAIDLAVFDKGNSAEYSRGFAAGVSSIFNSLLSAVPKDFQMQVIFKRNSVRRNTFGREQ